jgi:hypothetical protein
LLIAENKELVNKINVLHGTVFDLKNENENSRHLLISEKRDHESTKKHLADYTEVKRQNDQYKNDILESNKQRKEL